MKKRTKIIIIISSVVVGVTVVYFSSLAITAEVLFSRLFQYARPDYNITPGVININRVDQQTYTRETFKVDSNGNKISTYLYNQNNSDNLIIFSTGVHTGADDYLSWFCSFIDKGYSVLSYDYTGTFESEGVSYGFSQGIVDLDNILTYVENDNLLKNKNIYLLGYSMGAYSSSCILSKNHNIKAVASISGINQAEESILLMSEMYVPKFLVDTTGWYVRNYQRNHYGELSYIEASKTISESNVPTYIIQGEEDSLVKLEYSSIYKHAEEIKNPNVEYELIKGPRGDHIPILFSEEAINYQKEVNEHLNSLSTYEDISAYIANDVDHYKYSEPNLELMNNIIDFYTKY